jgi:hypothetical protein
MSSDKIQDSLVIETEGTEIFLCHKGTRIAKRGHAHNWIALEPGVAVHDLNYPDQIIVERFDD